MTGYRMTDPFGQVRSQSCQLTVMVSVMVIGYMTGSCGHGHASAAPDLGEDGPVMVDISNFTTAKILDKQLSPR
jgi:hypothetical protein